MRFKKEAVRVAIPMGLGLLAAPVWAEGASSSGAPVMRGGLGAAEASIAGMLGLLLGLTRDTAAAATLLIRFATLWFAVALGLIVWGFSKKLFFGPTTES